MPLETTTPKPTPVPLSRGTHPPTSPQLQSLDRNRRRRPSTRCSFSSAGASFSSKHSEIHRTLCAQDHDSFSYDPAHLKEFFVPPALWEVLPAELRDSISSLQHAGAAAMTGFDRLNILRDDLLDVGISYAELDSPTSPDSNELSVSSQDILHRKRSDSVFSRPGSRSGSRPGSPVIAFHLPGQPITAYYQAELASLRKEALVRLRHAARKVELELRAESVDEAVLEWWAGIRAKVERLDSVFPSS